MIWLASYLTVGAVAFIVTARHDPDLQGDPVALIFAACLWPYFAAVWLRRYVSYRRTK